MVKRRSFLKKATWGVCALTTTPMITFSSPSMNISNHGTLEDLKLSLAQWSLHRQIQDGHLDPVNFAKIASSVYQIKAVEYVNQFYVDNSTNEKFWIGMKERADDEGVNSLLIMVDDEGDLGIGHEYERKKSVENHYKWVNAAKILGCHSIRVNAFGASEKPIYRSAIVDAMGHLCDYAEKEGINVIIENHGLFSSDAQLITGIINEVDKPNFGTLPDFGNWCLSAKWGSTQIPCDASYDRYQGVSEFLPYAKGVSAKSYDFNDKGEDTRIDYFKMLKIVKSAGFNGYIGIEYEGELLSEHEGILATKALIENVWKRLG